MKILKSILSIFIALAVFTAGNGFIVEKYLCSGCNHEHNEVAFFEFGEINHEHPNCANCEVMHHDCTCHSDDHLNNARIVYLSLDELFYNSPDDIEFKEIVKILIPDFSTINFESLGFSQLFETNFSLLKIPPLVKSIAGSADFSAAICVFRL